MTNEPETSNSEVPMGNMVGNIIATTLRSHMPERSDYAEQIQKLFAAVTNRDVTSINEVSDWLLTKPERLPPFLLMLVGTQTSIVEAVGKLAGQSSHDLVETLLIRMLDKSLSQPDEPPN